jgi:hypothetical protein
VKRLPRVLNRINLKQKLIAGVLTGTGLIGLTAWLMFCHVRSQRGIVLPVNLGVKQYGFARCYPSTFELPSSVRQVNHNKATYYEVVAKSLDPQSKVISTLHLRTQGDACAWLNRARQTKRLSYMPDNVALAFAEAHYSGLFNKCLSAAAAFRVENPEDHCLQDMTQGLAGLKDKPQVFYQEEIKALKLLGIDPTKISYHRVEK